MICSIPFCFLATQIYELFFPNKEHDSSLREVVPKTYLVTVSRSKSIVSGIQKWLSWLTNPQLKN